MKILFVGNSFTARNDVPGMIARMASSRGERLDHEIISRGGASLRAHWNRGDAQSAIADGGFDTVVLQEQSTLPVRNPRRMHENVRLFAGPIAAAGARAALYVTWARQQSPDAQQAITEAYTTIAREMGAVLVPVGPVWHRFRTAHAEPVLYDRDMSHPSAAGSYLAACVFFTVLFRQSPLGLPVLIPNLASAAARALQAAAADAGEHQTTGET